MANFSDVIQRVSGRSQTATVAAVKHRLSPAPRRHHRAVTALSIATVMLGAAGVVAGLNGGQPASAGTQTETAAYHFSRSWSSPAGQQRDARRSGSSGWTSNRTPAPSAPENSSPVPAPAAAPSSTTSSTPPVGGANSSPSAAAAAPSAPAVSPQTGATASSGSGFASVQEFATSVPLGSWPGNGSAPAAYPNYLSYADGTSGKYYPSQVLSVHDGVLDWNVHNSKAAAVLPFGYQGFTYGTYSVRMRTDNFPQYHIAFLLWPNTDQWTHEFDGPEQETSASHPYPAVLQSTNPIQFLPANPKPSTPASWNDPGFHDYTWQWGPGFAAFYQDGTLVSRVTSNVPQQGMHPVLQVEFSNALSQGQRPDPSISGHVYVDRVMYDPSYTRAVPTS
jgi:hypothetical protein